MDEKLEVLSDSPMLDVNKKIDAEVKAMIDTEKQMKALMDPIIKQNESVKSMVNSISLSSALTSSFKLADKIGTSYLSALDTSSLLAFNYDNPLLKFSEKLQSSYAVLDQINAVNIALSKYSASMISKVYDSIVAINDALLSPAIQWLNSLDFSPMLSILTSIDFDHEYWDKHKELNKAYLTAMYKCKWFPYAGWTVNYDLFTEVTDILSTSKLGSARCEKRIDKAIFSYYTPKEIKNIKRSWKNSDLEPHIKKMLGQAIEAHLRGEYALTITCLATMWEGLIRYKLKVTRINQKKAYEELKELSIANNFEEIYSDFYANLILCDCSSPEDVIEGIPNRNAIGHSQYKKYPNKKSSLNAILITDFLIHLKPKETTEEIKDGQTEDAQS